MKGGAGAEWLIANIGQSRGQSDAADGGVTERTGAEDGEIRRKRDIAQNVAAGKCVGPDIGDTVGNDHAGQRVVGGFKRVGADAGHGQVAEGGGNCQRAAGSGINRKGDTVATGVRREIKLGARQYGNRQQRQRDHPTLDQRAPRGRSHSGDFNRCSLA